MIFVACLAVLVSLGLAERFALRRARLAVPIRVHVNGTRGKSTVTRLIAAALRDAGVPTLAKVTGTSPRLILPDGSERPVARRGPANVREQAWLLRQARRRGARAVVAECMAVRPDLQWASEREMVRATIGVITNVRRDHTEVMGRSVEEIAASLANSVPRRGVLVTGDARFAEVLAARCRPLGTRLVVANAASAESQRETRVDGATAARWWQEDAEVALAVTRELGIPDDAARASMQKAARDPGAVTCGARRIGGREVRWIDATAANDPESLDLLLTGLKPSSATGLKPCSTYLAGAHVAQDFSPAQTDFSPRQPGAHVAQNFSSVQSEASLVVYNHRSDRPDRLANFARFAGAFRRAPAIVVTGDRPSLTLVASVRQSCPHARVPFVPLRKLLAEIDSITAGDRSITCIVFCGNTRGFENPLATVQRGDRPPNRY